MQNNKQLEIDEVKRQLADMVGRIKTAEENGQFGTVWHEIAARLQTAIDNYERAAVRPPTRRQQSED